MWKYIPKQFDCIKGCGNKVSQKNRKCNPCASKNRGKHSEETKNKISQARIGKFTKHGKATYQHFCSDCNKPIDWRSKRCKSCATSGKNNPMYGSDFHGSKNPCYRGGITKLHFLIRESEKYNNWRQKVFERDNYTCQECGKIRNNIQSHHIKHFSTIFNDFLEKYKRYSPIKHRNILIKLAIKHKKFWNIKNGITLCEDCHKLRHKKEGKYKLNGKT